MVDYIEAYGAYLKKVIRFASSAAEFSDDAPYKTAIFLNKTFLCRSVALLGQFYESFCIIQYKPSIVIRRLITVLT